MNKSTLFAILAILALFLPACKSKPQPQKIYNAVETVATGLVQALETGLPILATQKPDEAERIAADAVRSLIEAQRLKLAWVDAVNGQGDLEASARALVSAANATYALLAQYGVLKQDDQRAQQVGQALSGLSVAVLIACGPGDATAEPRIVIAQQRDYHAWGQRLLSQIRPSQN